EREAYSIMELECSSIEMMFESRPRSSGLTFGLSVGGLQLLDKLTLGSQFPVLVGCQNKERFGPKRQAGYQRQSYFAPLKEDEDKKLFVLKFDKNPLNTTANNRFSIRTEPLDIVYNCPAFRRVRDIFSSKNVSRMKKSTSSISAAARLQYETLKRQTQADIKKSFTLLLEGSEKLKRWEIDMDIAAPQIILPEKFVCDNTNMIVLDLGHLRFHNTKKGTPDSSDEFLTPMSTPPSELEEDPQPSIVKLDTLSQQDLTEDQFYSKLYDMYTLELTDLQVMSGRMKDNWRQINQRTTTHLHLVDRLSISVHFERRLIYTADPLYPTIIASGTMPSLTLHVNEQKVQIINSCLSSLTPPLSEHQPQTCLSLSESHSGLHISDPRGVAPSISMETVGKDEEVSMKLKELLEDSQLLRAQFNINKVALEIHSRDRPIAELQVSNVKTSLTKRPYSMSMTLSVHSLLVVDALQMYGKDFELLMASHRNVILDCTGSLRDSAATSPMAVSPRSPPGSPMECLPSNLPSNQPTTSGGIHDVVARAFQALINTDDIVPKVNKGGYVLDRVTSPLPDSEALICVEYEMLAANSPSKKDDGALHVVDFQFNNLDIIANQETVVEILSFLKRITPRSSSAVHKAVGSDNTGVSQPNVGQPFKKQANATPHLELTADFNRLSVLLMRIVEDGEKKLARKVATVTMSSARVQASIDTRLSMTGWLGGFHVFDITPDAKRHQKVFCVGQDFQQHGQDFVSPDMYKTANESVFNDTNGDTLKAFSFQFSKPLRKFASMCSSPMFEQSRELLEEDNAIAVNLRVASLCYTHSPRFIKELSLCVSEFKEYKLSVAKSIKSVASEVAKGMIAKHSDLNQTGPFGSTSSIDMYTKMKSNMSADKTEMEFLENATTTEDGEQLKYKILLDASFDSPVIVVPKSATSSQVLIAHLGQITLSNRSDQGQIQFTEEVLSEENIDKEDDQKERIFLEFRRMNLYSVDVNQTLQSDISKFSDSMDYRALNINSDTDTPIMYDTTLQVTVDHIFNNSSAQINLVGKHDFDSESFMPDDIVIPSSVSISQPIMDIRAKIQTPLKIVLQKNVYEQILQTSDYLSSLKQIGSNLETNISTPAADKEDKIVDLKEDSSSTLKSSTSLDKTSFITKKVRFEVPRFNVELRGNFAEGEQGLVDLRLNRFLLDLTKDNPATTNLELSLKSIMVEDLLQPPDSPHRIIVMSKGPQREDSANMKVHQFLSHSCPDNAIVAPIPAMPGSLPSSFHSNMSGMNKPIISKPIISKPIIAVFGPRRLASDSGSRQRPSSLTPPLCLSRSQSHDELYEERLVHISLLLVDMESKEYTEKYNQTKRFVDVDLSCLEVKVNLQTWVVLLDFLGLGAKVQDIDVLAGREPDSSTQPLNPDDYVQAIVNSEISVKMEQLAVVLNKEEYILAEVSASKLNAKVTMKDGNMDAKGQLGKVNVLDLSPSGALYKERFLTVGDQALEFDFFKYGLPDPWCKRDYDIRLKVGMSSVRYTHTHKFTQEMLGFAQHFLQLQDVLGRMRAASAGKKINESAFHQARLLLDIEAGSPIILIPHSSRTTDVLVADLGKLSVKNCFRLAGDKGTFTEEDQNKMSSEDVGSESATSMSSLNTTQRSMSVASIGPARSMSLTDTQYSLIHKNMDPMQQSVYGSLDDDFRNHENDADISTVDIGSSVDPLTPTVDLARQKSRTSLVSRSDSIPKSKDTMAPASASGLNVFLMQDFFSQSMNASSGGNTFAENCNNAVMGEMPTKLSSVEDITMSGPCLLDVMEVTLSEMDLFSAERVEKQHYHGNNLRQDLEFPSCVIQRKSSPLLKEKCLLSLKIERNLDGDRSHDVPDIRVKGMLSSVHCCLDLAQYKLIRGLLDHNLGEKFENFKKELLTHMQDPQIQTVLSGKVWTVISMAVDLHNVTLELVTSHNLDLSDPTESDTSLAKLNFIRSCLSYESFSDQSKETDLVSQEILISDTRFRNVATNQRSSVFERILQPLKTGPRCGLQLDLHHCTTPEGRTLSVVINNMKVMCSFQWLIEVKEFIATKLEDPFFKDNLSSSIPTAPTPGGSLASSLGSQPASPVSGASSNVTSQNVQEEPPFHLKLNITDTEFVVVENLASLDTNAVILRSTAVVSYQPQSTDKMLSCTLRSLEVFSCNLQAEEETALSIVDPVTFQVTIEKNSRVMPIRRDSPTQLGIMDTRVFKQGQLLLEVLMDNPMNVRLSYQDMKLFLAIWETLPKQFKAKQSTESFVSDHHVERLREMGFSHGDCVKALVDNKNNVNEAANWLLQNAKPEHKKKTETKITTVEIIMKTLSLCLIDDCQDADVPLFELNFNGLNVKYEPGNEGFAKFGISGDYYNRTLAGWEPFLEQWKCQAQWRNYQYPDKKLALEISASDVLDISITSQLLQLYNMTKDKWSKDYYKHAESCQKYMESPCGVRRRQLLRPYAIRNLTGCLVYFQPVTVSPSHVATEGEAPGPGRQDWVLVPPGEVVPFDFQRKDKIRHKKHESLRVHQVIVRVDGWQKLTPLSVDKVGTFYRHAISDIGKQTIFKGGKRPHTRVVFDIAHEGTARKVITLRSALMLSNQLSEPIELRMDNPVIPGRFENFIIQSNQKKPIPIHFISSRLWLRPLDWPVNFCVEPINWQQVRKKGEVISDTRFCQSEDAIYRFAVAVCHENYPESSQDELHPLPGHLVMIMPPLTVHNLLPIDMEFYFKGTDLRGHVKPGKQIQIPAANMNVKLLFGVHLENFPQCKELEIPPADRSYRATLRLYDCDNRLLELNICVLCHVGGSLKLTVSVPYWLVNKSGLPLVFRQDGCREAAGQGEENEMARIVSPLLFNFNNESNSPYLCEMRLGKHKHGSDTVPVWCKGFALKNDADRPTVRQLNVAPRTTNRPDWIYNIGIEVKQGKGHFRATTIVTFAPRYCISNMSEHKLCIAQRHFTHAEAQSHMEGQLTSFTQCNMPFHWPRADLDQLLCVKLLDVEGCNWSGGFKIDEVSSFHINMRDESRNSRLLKVEVLLQGQTFNIVFIDADETPPPFRIDNFSEMPLQYFQAQTHDDRLRAVIKPNTSLPYALDEPTLPHYLTLSVPSGGKATYDLNKFGEGDQLVYQNYLFIAATATVKRNVDYSYSKSSDLVLDCEHDFVVFRKKEVGKRSQLWRMTSQGMLENEGRCQPLEPGKTVRPGQKYVLDVADSEAHPGKAVALALKKENVGRTARQKWIFKEGMLQSAVGNMCVQCPGGPDGLHDGAIAVLGPAPDDLSRVPDNMLMCIQKLNPGSGCLMVRMQMDGPVRVLQINDVQHRQIQKTISEDDIDWEIYEESLNHKTNEKRSKLQQRNIEFDMNLKGGLGVSLVNSTPEELLYIRLKNITLNYRENAKAVTMEMTVANIQADNQLLGATTTAMLFVTPVSSSDVVENTHALWISAHKLPNMGWNAEIFKHLLVKIKKLTLQLDEVLLWKLIQFGDLGQKPADTMDIESGASDLNVTLSSSMAAKTKRYYFGMLKIQPALITLSFLTPTGGLPTELYNIKKRKGIKKLPNFEDAKVKLDEFKKEHKFDSKEFYLIELKKHYSDQLILHYSDKHCPDQGILPVRAQEKSLRSSNSACYSSRNIVQMYVCITLDSKEFYLLELMKHYSDSKKFYLLELKKHCPDQGILH
ncbi:hypothetical protein DPMN_107177, partial [Dreissena polymorpha]